MKIEKISENQVKFILSRTDLEERNIEISELAYGSEKTYQLFQDMMRQAHAEFNFESENIPLMVEAMPIGNSHVVVVVTKIADSSETAETAFPPLEPAPPANGSDEKTVPQGSGLVIFSFASVDEVALVAKRLKGFYSGGSSLYKYEGRYFLVLQSEASCCSLTEAEVILYEYGEKHVSTDVSKSFLVERGETLITVQALEKLAWHL